MEITVLPSKKGLGAAAKYKTQKAAGTGAASSKHHGKLSGRKRRRMKAAAARQAAKAGDRQRQAQLESSTGEQGLFAFINDSLGHGSEAAAKLQAAGVYGPDEARGGKRQQTGGGAALAAAAAAAATADGGSSSSRGAGGSQQQQQQSDRKGLVGSQDDLAALKVCGWVCRCWSCYDPVSRAPACSGCVWCLRLSLLLTMPLFVLCGGVSLCCRRRCPS